MTNSNIRKRVPFFCLFSTDPGFAITECHNGTFVIVNNQSVSITCTGLSIRNNIYWFLTGPPGSGFESRLGNCTSCGNSCSTCTINDTGYNITRTQNDTTLSFVGNLQLHSNATFNCSNYRNTRFATCDSNVINGTVFFSLPLLFGRDEIQHYIISMH